MSGSKADRCGRRSARSTRARRQRCSTCWTSLGVPREAEPACEPACRSSSSMAWSRERSSRSARSEPRSSGACCGSATSRMATTWRSERSRPLSSTSARAEPRRCGDRRHRRYRRLRRGRAPAHPEADARQGLTSIFIITVGLAFVIRNTLFITFGAGARSFNVDQAEVFVVGPIRVSPGPGDHHRRHHSSPSALSAGFSPRPTSAARCALCREQRPCGGDRREHRPAGDGDLAAGRLPRRSRRRLPRPRPGYVRREFRRLHPVPHLHRRRAWRHRQRLWRARRRASSLGLAMEVSTWDGFAGGLDPRYKLVLAFVALIVLLLLRPEGIFGKARLL